MINFIIYDKDKEYRELYISIILKIIGNRNIAYKIIELDQYTSKTLDIINNLIGKKIFIFDIDVPGMSGLDLAKTIRESNDWHSPIIISTTIEKLECCALNSKLLILSYISKYFECAKNIKDSLIIGLRILEQDKSLNFQYNGEIYQIPYQSILYIERDTNLDISIINTKSSKIEINKTINELETILKEDNKFFKTHRSCIVNIQNITNFKLDDSIIRFNKKSTRLITRENKKILKEKLLDRNIVRC